MNFNEIKYKKCIDHLKAIKISIIIAYIIIFSCTGAGACYPFVEYENQSWHMIIIGASIGALFGLLFSLFFTWRVEMKIQEAYWRIDIMKELKNQTSLAQKSSPIAKAIVSIENKSTPTNPTSQVSFSSEKAEEKKS